MGITNLRAVLQKRYSSLSGKLNAAQNTIARINRDIERLPELEAKVAELDALVASVALVLRDACPDWSPEQTPPLLPWSHVIPVPFGTCGRRAMAVLRKADKPMTVREIAAQVLAEVGCRKPDRIVMDRTAAAIDASLRKHRGRTVESSGKYPAQWRSIINPDMQFGV